MIFSKIIEPYASTPLSYHLVKSLLKDFSRPNDKISELVKTGNLLPIKKGMYIAGKNIETIKPNLFLISNHLLGPSYISLDSALSWYGYIPEQVFTTTAITTKASRIFINELGRFEYVKQHLPAYTFGITQVKLAENQLVLMACPEKALLDKITNTSDIQFNSKKDVLYYLLNNLRMDVENLKNLETSKMKTWINSMPKKKSILLLIKVLENL